MRAFVHSSGILIGNSVCWLVIMERVKILQFDLDEQTLVFMDIPSNVYDLNAYHHYMPQKLIMPVDGGGINFIVLEGFTVRVWKRMSSDTGDASRPSGHEMPVLMLASSEDGNVMFRLVDGGVIIMVHLRTMQLKKLAEKIDISWCYPFMSFYIAGN